MWLVLRKETVKLNVFYSVLKKVESYININVFNVRHIIKHKFVLYNN